MAIRRTSSNSISNAVKLSTGFASAAIPNSPTIGTATAISDVAATVEYTAAVLGATASTFTATSNPGSVTGTGSSPITVTGLTASTAYTFTVTAGNANGTSAASSASNSITTSAPVGSFESIATITGNTSNTVTFTSIPQTFTHLQLRVTARCALGGYSFSGYTFRLGSSNSIDSGNNYSYHRFYTSGNNSFGTDGAANYGSLGDVFFTANDAIANNFAVSIIDIWDYTNTSKYKTTKHSTAFDNNATGNTGWNNASVGGISYGSGNWRSFNAVNTLQLIVGGVATNNTNNVYALYGIKGA